MNIHFFAGYNCIFFYFQSFDECVAKAGADCDPENLWMQIPFFCGHAAECWSVSTSLKIVDGKNFDAQLDLFYY